MTRTDPRRGNVAAATAVTLTGILAVTALALDGGVLMDKRRQVQAAADAAALAAAADLYHNWFTYYGKRDTPGLTARSAALSAARANGFEDGAGGVAVAVRILPTTGPFAGVDGHVEVVITASQRRFFSRLWGSADVGYGARAVARGRRGGVNHGIIVLAPTGRGAFTTGGGAGMVLTGAPMLVNSTDPQAMYANGNGTVSAPEFDVGGSPGYATPGGGTFTGTIVPNSPYNPDPLANLPAPDPNALPVRSRNKTQISGNQTRTLWPGVYQDGVSMTGGTLTLMPGVYYMDGGGFNISGQANVTGSGVMIYNAPRSNSDKIDISGQGNINLSPPTTGPYQGVLLFQDRTSTAPVSISGSNATAMTISGTFYAASAALSVSGNGTQQTIGAQYISYNLNLSGNGTFRVHWRPDVTPGVREVWLVE